MFYIVFKTCKERRSMSLDTEKKEEIWLSHMSKQPYTFKTTKNKVIPQRHHQKVLLHTDWEPTIKAIRLEWHSSPTDWPVYYFIHQLFNKNDTDFKL